MRRATKKIALAFWITALKSGRKFYRTSDLMKVSGLHYAACRMAAMRLVKRGILVRVAKELYGNLLVDFRPEEAACQAYLPSYLSCEYALSHHGVIDQMPAVLTAVTLRRSKRVQIGSIEVAYKHLRKNLFWGYVREEGCFIAEPEKAILDWLYLAGRKLKALPLDEIVWDELSISKLTKYSSKFPKAVRRHISKKWR